MEDRADRKKGAKLKKFYGLFFKTSKANGVTAIRHPRIERFFSELLATWVGETTVFVPIKALVENVFEVEKFRGLTK